MKILVAGGGGREHAITWRLSRDPVAHELFCAPGNPGTAKIATNLPIAADDTAALATWARENRPDLVVIGPEAPLVKGVADALLSIGIPVFGPVSSCAKIEGSKSFAKEIMSAAGVPTAAAEVFTDPAAAKAAIARFGLPVVVKADGLAAGKGVVVAATREEAEEAIDSMLVGGRFGESGAKILLEEFLDGEECSILAVSDGAKVVLLPSSQDHKRAFDGDKGPNTGGMGAYAPAPIADAATLETTLEKIVKPVIHEMARRGTPYRGILYAGLMVAKDGSKPALSGSRVNVVEFNARFGDPETEAVLQLVGGDFSRLLLHAATGRLSDGDLEVERGCAATVIVASGGYPGEYAKGRKISGVEAAEADGAAVFHCGTRLAADGTLETAGGRVLAATAKASTLRGAVDAAYSAVSKISFDGMFFRKDVAHRAFVQA